MRKSLCNGNDAKGHLYTGGFFSESICDLTLPYVHFPQCHDRSHGSELPEDMTIPMFFIGPNFEPGKKLSGIGLLDIAPTISQILGVPGAREWEGRYLVEKVGE